MFIMISCLLYVADSFLHRDLPIWYCFTSALLLSFLARALDLLDTFPNPFVSEVWRTT